MEKHKRNRITQNFHENIFKDLNTFEILLLLKKNLEGTTHNQSASSLNSLDGNFLSLPCNSSSDSSMSRIFENLQTLSIPS